MREGLPRGENAHGLGGSDTQGATMMGAFSSTLPCGPPPRAGAITVAQRSTRGHPSSAASPNDRPKIAGEDGSPVDPRRRAFRCLVAVSHASRGLLRLRRRGGWGWKLRRGRGVEAGKIVACRPAASGVCVEEWAGKAGRRDPR